MFIVINFSIKNYEFIFRISYNFIRAERGARGDYGVQMEPDVPAHIEVNETWIFCDKEWYEIDIPEIALTDTLKEILEEHVGWTIKQKLLR